MTTQPPEMVPSAEERAKRTLSYFWGWFCGNENRPQIQKYIAAPIDAAYLDGWLARDAALAAQPPEPAPHSDCRNRRYCSACQRFVHTGGYCTGCGLGVEKCEHAESAPPQPGDAERLAQELVDEFLDYTKTYSKDGYELFITRNSVFARVLVLRITTAFDEAKSALAASRAEIARLQSVLEMYQEMADAAEAAYWAYNRACLDITWEDREAGNLAQQLIDGANREGVDTYTKTLLWHASSLIDRLTAARENHDDVQRAGNFLQWLRKSDHPESTQRRELAGLFTEARGRYEAEVCATARARGVREGIEKAKEAAFRIMAVTIFNQAVMQAIEGLLAAPEPQS